MTNLNQCLVFANKKLKTTFLMMKFMLKNILKNLPTWEGDKIFLKLLDENSSFFSLKLVYEGDRLTAHTLEFAKSK